MSSKVKKVAFLRPQELERNIMALSFKDGVVSKIEHYDLADGNDVAIDQQTSASANDKVGFWRKYFGGVGSYSMFGKSDDKDF